MTIGNTFAASVFLCSEGIFVCCDRIPSCEAGYMTAPPRGCPNFAKPLVNLSV